MLDQATLDAGRQNDVSIHVNFINHNAPPSCAVAETARKRLQSSMYRGVRAVHCEYHEGSLVLRGRVSSFFHKQLVQEAVRDIRGVEAILNVVEVVVPDGS